MSEVKRYRNYDGEISRVLDGSEEPDDFVRALEFDAQRLRADTADAELQALRLVFENAEDCELNDAELKLAAAEQHNAELSGLLQRSKIDAELWFSEFGEPSSCDYSAAFTEIDAALNPNPEAAVEAGCTCWLQPQEPQCVNCPSRNPEAESHE